MTTSIDRALEISAVLGLMPVKYVAKGERADLYIWCEIDGEHERDEDGEVIDCEGCVYSPTPREELSA